jgi:hypothetical protein
MPTPNETTELPAGSSDDGRQLAVLLDVAQSLVDEEFRRSERLDAKARNQFTAVGGLFAVVMAVTAGVLNALLGQRSVGDWVYPALGGCALASIVALAFALTWSVEAWRLRKSDALDPDTIEEYVSYAERGNIAVTKQLIKAYAQILRDRRSQNAARAHDLKLATAACFLAGVASLVQLGAVFVALIET